MAGPPGDRQRGVLLVTQGLATALMTDCPGPIHQEGLPLCNPYELSAQPLLTGLETHGPPHFISLPSDIQYPRIPYSKGQACFQGHMIPSPCCSPQRGAGWNSDVMIKASHRHSRCGHETGPSPEDVRDESATTVSDHLGD